MSITELIDSARLADHLDEGLVLRFFAAFSRFEYALKAVNGAADPNWVAFAKAVEEQFAALRMQDEQLREAVDALLVKPPRKQTSSQEWDTPAPQGAPASALNLLLLVRRVRNNLFHGGKAQRGVDGERDNRLACDERVRDRFVEA